MKSVRRSMEFPGVLYERLLKEKKESITKTSVQTLVIRALLEKYGLEEKKAS